jgi:hypothetical protein
MRGWLLAGVAVVAAVAGGSVWAFRSAQAPPPSDRAPAAGLKEQAPAGTFSYGRDPLLDDSGYFVLMGNFKPHIKDPLSLEQIRDAVDGAGFRGIERIDAELAQGVSPERRLDRLQHKALMYLYEGQFTHASAVLADARALAEANPGWGQRALPTLIFLQGVAALRRGETENCVECGCVSSCIFPIQPEAVHRKRKGSSEAVKYFTEYLQQHPEDVGVRWLLNLAYMTLGDYPDRVPPQDLIPLDAFRSELDIGRFRDLAPQLGVNRLDQAGGAVMDDFDNDGLLDIVETSWDPAVPMAFYRNRGDGTFEERSKEAGLEGQIGGLYCVQTDYNNDGWLDLYVCRGAWAGPQRHSLLRNNKDGTFTDVTEAAGLLMPINGQVAVWADYDNDGWLDLFVGGEKTRSRLFHNKGDGTFEEVAAKAGVANEGLFCKGASWGDYDGDGYPDLYVSVMDGANRLFHNNRDGTFTDVAADLGVVQPWRSFSCWFFDYDNDGWPDLFVAGYNWRLSDVINSHLGRPHQGEICRLYHNVGGRRFEDVTAAVGLDVATCPMGSNFADFDNDGFLDIYLGTGSTSYSMLVPNRMFKNVDGRRFSDVTTSSGTGHLQKGHAVACGDWDRDGSVDLFVQLGGATRGDRYRNVLFQNPGQGNHWITVKLAGRKTNRAAIGARIKVTPAGDPARAIYRHVTSGSSFGANALQQTIGVGKADRIATLEVYWPTSRTTQVFRDVPVDQAIEVTEFEPDYRPLHWSRVPLP